MSRPFEAVVYPQTEVDEGEGRKGQRCLLMDKLKASKLEVSKLKVSKLIVEILGKALGDKA